MNMALDLNLEDFQLFDGFGLDFIHSADPDLDWIS